MTWRDKDGTAWNARRKNGWPNDDKAPDGYTVGGYRKIDRKGRIRFGGTYWKHDSFMENIGRVVRVNWGGMPGDFNDERAIAFYGHPDACPETIFEHHSSFFDHRSMVYCDDDGDWNKRPVTKF